MFKVNDCIFYSTIGICRITAIQTTKRGEAEERECYVIKPMADPHSTLFVPTDQEGLAAHMRHLLSKDEIDGLIQNMPMEESIWISNERDRSKEYFAKISSGDIHDLIKIIKTLYQEKGRKKATGKGLNTTDNRIMNTAEKLLHEEFAFVLGIDPKDVAQYIQDRLPHQEAAHAH